VVLKKRHRIEKLKQFFEKYKQADKEEIDQHLASEAGHSPDRFYKSLYRDLADLVAEGYLEREDYEGDGTLIDTIDKAPPSYYKSKWFLANYVREIKGASILREHQCYITSSRRLEKEIMISTYARSVKNEFVSIGFNLKNKVYSLVINSYALPVSILISRASEGDGNIKERMNELQNRYGHRLIWLRLPYSSLSRVRPEEDRFGNLVADINIEGKVLIKPTNGVNNPRYFQASSFDDILELNNPLLKGIHKFEDTGTIEFTTSLNFSRFGVYEGPRHLDFPSVVAIGNESLLVFA
jgi:hypothetical protein